MSLLPGAVVVIIMARMVRGVLFVALGLCACADPNPLSFEPIVEVRDVGDLLVDVRDVEGQLGYVVKFTNRHGLPTELVYNSRQILADGPQPFESLIGTAIYPGTTASGALVDDTTADVVIELDGPVVARTSVTYSVPYTCNDTAQHLSGTSTFTFFPGGRIVRFDDVTANDSMLTMREPVNNCTGTNDSNYFFTSFWTLLDQSTITMPDGTIVNTVPTGGQIDYNQPSACMRYPDLDVHAGIEWTGSATRLVNGVDPGIAGAGDRFVFDFERQAPTVDGGRRGMIESAIQLSGDDNVTCQSLLDPSEDRAIRIDERATAFELGIYTDDAAATYGKTITIQGGSTAVAPGFVISLAGIHEHMRVNRPNTSGRYFAPQLERDTDRTLLWFRDELPPGETIELELLE